MVNAGARVRVRFWDRIWVMIDARARFSFKFRLRVTVNAMARVSFRVRAGAKGGLVLVLSLG